MSTGHDLSQYSADSERSTVEKGYLSRREEILGAINTVLQYPDREELPGEDGAVELSFMYDVLDSRFEQESSHEIWAGLNELYTAGKLAVSDDGENTVLHAREPWDPKEEVTDQSLYEHGDTMQDLLDTARHDAEQGDLDTYSAVVDAAEELDTLLDGDTRLPGYNAAYTDGVTEQRRETLDWQPVADTTRPALDVDIAEEFFARNGYDVDRFTDGAIEGVTAYTETARGDKEHRVTVTNDAGTEEDLASLRYRFKVPAGYDVEEDLFQPRHRESYIEQVWTPVTVMQQRIAHMYDAVDSAADMIPDLAERWTAQTGEERTGRGAVERELQSLTGRDSGYEEMRDALVEQYYAGGTRYSRLLAPWAETVESTPDSEGLLPYGETQGDTQTAQDLRSRNQAYLQLYLDAVYDTAEQTPGV